MYVAAMIRGQTIARNYANPVAVARCLEKKKKEKKGKRPKRERVRRNESEENERKKKRREKKKETESGRSASRSAQGARAHRRISPVNAFEKHDVKFRGSRGSLRSRSNEFEVSAQPSIGDPRQVRSWRLAIATPPERDPRRIIKIPSRCLLQVSTSSE